MIAVTTAVGGSTLSTLYRATIDEERARLNETAQSQARLMEAVARFDAQHSTEDVPGGAFAATLSQMIVAETGKRGYLITGEKTYLEPYQESLWPDGTDSAQQEKPEGGNQVQVIP